MCWEISARSWLETIEISGVPAALVGGEADS
jgi:hypothetical protein